MKCRTSRGAGIGVAVVAIALAGASEAVAGKIEVTTKKEEGQGSFSAAVQRANKRDGKDQIRFAKRLRGEIELPAEMTLKGTLDINGNGYGVPDGKKFRRLVLKGHRGGTRMVVAREGDASVRGLYLDGVALRAQRSDLSVRDSFLTGERTVDEAGISASGEELRVLRTTVEKFDSGITAGSATARIDQSTIAGNVGGGGVVVGSGSEADVSNSTISGNVASGALANGAGLSTGPYSSTARVVNSTITDNLATSDSSLSGGLFGNVEVLNSTITANRSAKGAGVAGDGNSGDVDVRNSIVYGNVTFGGTAVDCAKPFTSSGGNLIGAPGECLLDPQDRSGVDPLLGPLADNGGPTATQSIDAASPAIDLASPSTATDFDQRGVKRGSSPDAGAFERRG